MKTVLGTLLALCAFLVLAWFVGSWLHLAGASLWILRGGLAFIGIVAAASILFFVLRGQGKSAGPSASDSDIDVLVANAVKRLENSPLPQKHSLDALTTVFLLGDSGSTKTSVVMNAGLEPELLAGQIYQDTTVVPTQIANLLFNKQALFVDVGGPMMAQQPRWQQLLRRLQRGKFTSAFGGSAQPLRAAVVCFSCEEFLQPGANERALASARKLAMRLQELSRTIGISFPVYVLFTKTDRVPFFLDFFKNLTRDEATLPVGVTLPLNMQSAGVYAEEENRRVSAKFDELFFALSEKRLDLLPRESEANSLPTAYEFPREFRKLRNLIVQFLVELGRPSQLSVNPFVRGFYFAGVRPIVVEDMPGLSIAAAAPSSPEHGATQLFHAGQFGQQQQVAARVPTSRRVPQWMFVTRLFHDVILKDRAAMATSTFSVRTSMVRRILLGCLIFVFFVLAVGFTISFALNKQLHSEVLAAANAIRNESVPTDSNPTIDQLQKLDRLRQDLLTLQQYKKNGAPFSMRWGLYTGDELLDPARKIYFNRFNSLLFASSQGLILNSLERLPNAPGPQDNYETPYRLLKAYLITTTNHEKSTVDFLSPVLYDAWAHGRTVDDNAAQLIKKQFDFYSSELLAANPYSSAGNDQAIAHARSYLSQFQAIERIYRSMLEQASKNSPTITFERDVVRASKSVDGAFSAKGYAAMQDAISNHRFMTGEEWVLGPITANFDAVQLEQQLRQRYHDDFLNKWREFLRSSSVSRYRDVHDAVNKLGILSANRSPLLELIKVISTNTATAGDAAQVFQPAQSVVPPGNGDTLVGGSNQGYLQGLVGLQISLQQLAAAGIQDQNALAQVRSNSATATTTTINMANNFRPDNGGDIDQVVKNLLLAPIRNADSIVNAMGPAELNGQGKALCASFRQFANLYPFNPNATQEANIQDVNRFFGAGGVLSAFYDQNLKNFVQRQGSDYLPNPSGSIHINAAFLTFFTHAMRFSEAAYGGTSQPQLHFTMRPASVDGLDNVSLELTGQKVVSPGSAVTFTWRASDLDHITMTGNSNITLVSYPGAWSVFHFFYEADHTEAHGNVYTSVWIPKTSGQPMKIGGKNVTVRYDVDMQGAAPILQKGYLQGMRCVAEVAH
ncbi:MAG TPA: ImcF-related family protein [Candidatus Koribacter sp.]|jgi:type VI secretion system protein ImpL